MKKHQADRSLYTNTTRGNYPYPVNKIGGDNTIISADFGVDEPPYEDFVTIKWRLNGVADGACIHKDRLLEALLEYFNNHLSENSKKVAMDGLIRRGVQLPLPDVQTP